jgi:hypothetical protein
MRSPTLNATQERPAVGKAAAKIRAIEEAAARNGTGAAAAAEDSPKPVKPIPGPVCDQLADHKRNVWFITPEPDTRPEDLESNPAALVCATKWKAGDRVEAPWQDWSRWAEYVVVCGTPGFVTLKLLRSVALQPVDVSVEEQIPEGTAIRQGGPHEDPWVAYRVADGFVMNAGRQHRTKREAATFLITHPAYRKV